MSNLLLERSAQMGRHSLLPKEYQQVEYIESTGTQWIDLGIRGNSEYSYELTYQMTSKMVGAIFGCRNQSTYYSGPTFGYSYTNVPTTATVAYSGISKGQGSQGINIIGSWQGANNLQKHTVSFSPTVGIVLLDNTPPTHWYAMSPAFETDYNLYLFCNNVAGTKPSPQKMKFYQLTIRSASGKLLNNFVPCYRKSDGVIGLFDSGTRRFLVNDGTGQFIKHDIF